MQIERIIYQYAVRKAYHRLLRENQHFRNFPITDVEIALGALSCLAESDNFDDYDCAWQIIETICNDENSFLETEERERLILFLKLLHLLKTVGRQSVESVVALLNDHFRLPETSFRCQVTDEFNECILNDTIKECRMYVLRLLISDERQIYFRDEKFPLTFAGLNKMVKNSMEKFIKLVYERLPPAELELINQGISLASEDPSVLLFRETFSQNASLDEQSLIDFLKLLRESQLTVTPPNFLQRLSDQRENKVETVSSPQQNNISDNSLSIDGSDDLFPSLDRSFVTTSQQMTYECLLKPCFVSVKKLTEDEIQKYR